MPSRFAFFAAVFLLGALHAWIGWRILPPLRGAAAASHIGILYLMLSFLLIPAGLFSRAIQRQPWSDWLAWAGMLAMGMFSSLLLLTVLREIVLLLLPFFSVATANLRGFSSWAVVIGATLLTLIGYFNARRVATVIDVEVPIRHLPPPLHGFTIVQISDIHVGPTIKHHFLRAIVDKVNDLQADVVAITGDLVDGSVRQLSPHTAPLAQLKSRHGVFFVTGNHEYYANAEEWIKEIRRLGLTVLINEHVVLEHNGATLVLAGVTDFASHHFIPSHRSDPQAAIANAPSGSGAKILLAHQPRSAAAAAAAGFDLQLSGHTHGGQFFPWNLCVPLQQPYVAGLNRLHDLWVYTSRGTGYWGPPKRLLAPSEITRVTLVSAEQQKGKNMLYR